ncbi:hypothetical protein HC031_16390 [Planosporangium thailandense]|uniref:Capsular polysaccharide biosynthesis protein n=1 Tax=Planosporangium thailandense TaxID=765197 RepID=A0ABX0XYX8_9ACTN|nr:hypothetical protein [Planosporangium thailandense]NJC71280.1 hypothetical protein [Planosporangium thailandense]
MTWVPGEPTPFKNRNTTNSRTTDGHVAIPGWYGPLPPPAPPTDNRADPAPAAPARENPPPPPPAFPEFRATDSVPKEYAPPKNPSTVGGGGGRVHGRPAPRDWYGTLPSSAPAAESRVEPAPPAAAAPAPANPLPPSTTPSHADEGSRTEEPRAGKGDRRSERRSGGRAWKAVVLAILMVVGFTGASVGYSLLQPTVHGAQTEFVLTPRNTLSDAMVDRAMVTQTMILKSVSVLGPVAAQTGIPVGRLRDRVSADIVGRSDVLRLTVGDRSQTRAVQLVQLISAEFLKASNAATRPATDTPLRDDTPPITLSILTPASPLDRPLQPQPVRALAAGLLIGLLAAAVAATVVMRPRLLASPSQHWT